MQHIVEMRTPAPEVVLAEFRAQKGIAGDPTEPAAAPETIAEEPAAEDRDGAITPRSGGALCAHILTCRCASPTEFNQWQPAMFPPGAAKHPGSGRYAICKCWAPTIDLCALLLALNVLTCGVQRPSQRSRRCMRMRMCCPTAWLPRSARHPGRRHRASPT